MKMWAQLPCDNVFAGERQKRAQGIESTRPESKMQNSTQKYFLNHVVQEITHAEAGSHRVRVRSDYLS